MSAPCEGGVGAFLRLVQGQAIADPFPDFALMREEGPLWVNPLDGSFVAAAWSSCDAVLREERLGHDLMADAAESGRADWWEHPVFAVDQHLMLRMNGEAHSRVRRPMSKEFTARRVAQIGAHIEVETRRLLAHVEGSESVDIVEALCLPLPVSVIGELIGIPRADRAQFIPWVKASILEPVNTPEDVQAGDDAITQMWTYLRELVAIKRASPDDGLASALAAMETDSYSEDELVGNLLLLFGAGFVTTVHMLGSLFALLGGHPDIQRQLRGDRSRIPRAVNETLRLESPIQWTGRRALTDVEIEGMRIAQGQNVFVALAGANRDPARFEEADAFRLDRADSAVLSFGAGPHFCVGAALARAEGEIALGCALDTFGSWTLLDTARQPTASVRGFEAVTIQPAGA